MFFVKFFESLFANGLKDKSGPSIFPAYLLSWSYVNFEFCKVFVTTSGELSVKASQAFNLDVSMFSPIVWAVVIVVVAPWMKNIGLTARELSDYLTQSLLQKMKIKSYKTAEQYEQIHGLLVSAKESGQSAQTELATLKSQQEEVGREHLLKLEELKGEFMEDTHKLKNSHMGLLKQLEDDKGREARDFKNVIDSLDTELTEAKEVIRLLTGAGANGQGINIHSNQDLASIDLSMRVSELLKNK